CPAVQKSRWREANGVEPSVPSLESVWVQRGLVQHGIALPGGVEGGYVAARNGSAREQKWHGTLHERDTSVSAERHPCRKRILFRPGGATFFPDGQTSMLAAARPPRFGLEEG